MKIKFIKISDEQDKLIKIWIIYLKQRKKNLFHDLTFEVITDIISRLVV
ncbi:hypothetical protein J4714_12045 [Staphylococcus epidermidis]|nr:hypothetical protein [Staphylococcus epidermidis]